MSEPPKIRPKTFMDVQYSAALKIINSQREEIEYLKPFAEYWERVNHFLRKNGAALGIPLGQDHGEWLLKKLHLEVFGK